MFRLFRALPISLMLLLSSGLVSATDDNIMEGVHYERITPAQPTAAPKGKIEVTELFWYGCPHCFRFEPYVEAWLKRKSDNVIFTRVPAVVNPKWETHARVYYAAEALGVVEKIHEPFFNKIHVGKKHLHSEKDILNFMAGLGIDEKKFKSAMRSFTVSSKVQHAKKLGKAFKINGVPSIVVNGKYLTSGSHAGSLPGMIQMTNYLVKKELDAIVRETKTDTKTTQ